MRGNGASAGNSQQNGPAGGKLWFGWTKLAGVQVGMRLP